ncbi:MAG: hypothetical protein IKO47_12825 [Ruminococcus sp.]|nr:hypothetical protein [Ruminococcus sp.]
MIFAIAARRTKRVLISLKRSAVRALASDAVLSAAAFAIYLLSGRNTIMLSDALLLMLAVFLPLWLFFFFLEIKKYGMKIFHRYDEDIIGSAFTGLDRKSRTFELGVHIFHSGNFREALEVFTELDTSDLPRSREEQGIISFYRARCYQIMGIYPNALINYEKAEENGFILPEMPLFKARCLSESGDTKRAVQTLMGLIDTDHHYSSRARCEIGNIYLKLNDGKNALRWYNEAIERRESYASALGGAAVAYNLLRDFNKASEYFRLAMLNNIEDPSGFTNYFEEVQAAVLLGSPSDGAKSEPDSK